MFYRGNKIWVHVLVHAHSWYNSYAPELVPMFYYRDKGVLFLKKEMQSLLLINNVRNFGFNIVWFEPSCSFKNVRCLQSNVWEQWRSTRCASMSKNNGSSPVVQACMRTKTVHPLCKHVWEQCRFICCASMYENNGGPSVVQACLRTMSVHLLCKHVWEQCRSWSSMLSRTHFNECILKYKYSYLVILHSCTYSMWGKLKFMINLYLNLRILGTVLNQF